MNFTSPKNWKTHSIYSLAQWVNGLAFKAEDFSKKGTGLPVIKINELKSSINDQTAYTEKEFDQKYLLKNGDMLFSWSGSPETSIDIYWYDFVNGWLNQHIFKVIPDSKLVDKNFFYFLLKSQKPVFVHLAKQRQTTGLGHVTVSDLKELQVSIPESLDDQREIAAILGSLDDKIELLRKENKTLESIAQTLFKEWFVDFRFPGYEGVKVVDGVPEGWRAGKLSDICLKIASGGTPQTKENSYWDGGVRWFSTKELQDQFLIDSEKTMSESGLENSSAKLFPINTVVVAIYAAPTVGRLGILTKESSFNQAACGLVANEEIISFEYIYLLLLLSRDILNQMANGAAQQNLSVGTIRDFKILIPTKGVSDNFRDVVRPIFDKIKTNTLEIKTLSRSRDDLLNKIFNNL